MFCNKSNVNILVSLLAKSRIKDIVACPGSRNAVILHDLAECGKFRLHSVTDERGASFVAIGIHLATRCPVGICVTSGSAVLNTKPGISEAYYRNIPLLVISADRPQLAINQLDGQTIPQPNVLQPFAKCFDLLEVKDEQDSRLCKRIANEAIMQAESIEGGPVQINVRISEPLFSFINPQLPVVTKIRQLGKIGNNSISGELIAMIGKSQLPALFVGQMEVGRIKGIERIDEENKMLVLPEIVSGQANSWRNWMLDKLNLSIQPDFILHIGGNIVNKGLKNKLRNLTKCEVVRLDEQGSITDTFFHLSSVIKGNTVDFINALSDVLPTRDDVSRAKEQLNLCKNKIGKLEVQLFSDLGILQKLANTIKDKDLSIHLANSSVVRNFQYFFHCNNSKVFCNRGVNGIEGSLSSAAGYSLLSKRTALAITGDLSFFYDANSLWNEELKGNFKIILLNNHCGEIFYRLPNLNQTPTFNRLVTAHHKATAEGIAKAFNLEYIRSDSFENWEEKCERFFNLSLPRPIIWEFTTNTQANEEAITTWLKHANNFIYPTPIQTK